MACVVLSCAVAGLALSELNRVERGNLFLFALRGELAASEVEDFDARQSAAFYKYPAVRAVQSIALALGWYGKWVVVAATCLYVGAAAYNFWLVQ